MSKPMNRPHYAPLDGLRGVAILMVILTHTYRHSGSNSLAQVLTAIAGAGWVGVTLFFSLSGFLITGILLDSRGNPGWYVNFFARRALRIFPIYYLFLGVYFFVLPLWEQAEALFPLPAAGERGCYWLYLANMKEWITGRSHDSPALNPLWSLSVEEQIYLLWPLIISIVPWKMFPRVFLGMFLFAAAWKTGTCFLKQSIELRYAWTPACLDAFAAGGYVAWLSRDREGVKRLPSLARSAVAGMGLFLLGMCVGQRHFNFWSNPAPMLTFGSTAVAVFCSGLIGVLVSSPETSVLNRVFTSGWLCWCGRYSYAAYLGHEVAIALLTPLFPGWDAATKGWITIPRAVLFTTSVVLCTFAGAWLSWHLFEKHFLALKKYFPSGGRGVAPATGRTPSVQPVPEVQPVCSERVLVG